jgi:hypothetical protein
LHPTQRPHLIDHHRYDLGMADAQGTSERRFAAADARTVAHEVVHFDPARAQRPRLVPQDWEAASAAIDALADELRRLPITIRSALEGAASSAGLISEDRLQGISELIQNADDMGALDVIVEIDEQLSQLRFHHDGAGVTLHDVWALAIPWLSLKTADADKLGRFGIGLKTLQSLSDVLDVHHGDFHFRISDRDIASIEATRWHESGAGEGTTTFVVPFRPGALTAKDVSKWLRRWGAGGLIFLSSVSKVDLLGAKVPLTLSVDRGSVESVGGTAAPMQRRTIRSGSGSWTRYERRVAAPVEARSSRKARGLEVAVSIAFADFDGDPGALHVGLPVREIGLPFRINAPFDPLASRRDIAPTNWNVGLIAVASELWRDAIVDRFAVRASEAWQGVPLLGELAAKPAGSAEVSSALSTVLMTESRRQMAERVLMRVGDGRRLGFSELSYEASSLEGRLSTKDIQDLAGVEGVVEQQLRSPQPRWRFVLKELESIGAVTPLRVEPLDALPLLGDSDRSVAFVADLFATIIGEGYGEHVWNSSCLVLEGGERIRPADVEGSSVLIPRSAGPLWAVLGLGRALHGGYRRRPEWPVVRDWLRKKNILLATASDVDALRALAKDVDSDARQPVLVDDAQLEALRAALETLGDADRRRYGRGIGSAILVDGQRSDGSKLETISARPSESYLIERESNSWATAAARTRGLTWVHRRYQTVLRPTPGVEAGLGAQRLFRLLGADNGPRVMPHPDLHKRYAYGAPGLPRLQPGSPDSRKLRMSEVGATYTLNDTYSPDLIAVLQDIASAPRGEREKRGVAVLSTLSRIWDRLSEDSTVQAAAEQGRWVYRAMIDAWWVSQAASIPWLTTDDGSAACPQDVRIRTTATVALLGDDAMYLPETIDPVSNAAVLEALGVQGDPHPEELIDRIRDVASDASLDPPAAADQAAPYYRALALQASAGSLDSRRQPIRAAFGRGDGLIATNIGWRRPSVTLAGPAIFGDLRPFVPPIEGGDSLWSLLGMARPGPTDAVEVISRLARQRELLSRDQELIMLESLRVLVATPRERLPKLTRSPVWAGGRWLTTRPVYAIENPLLSVGLRRSLSVWDPGGTTAAFRPLYEPYGLVELDEAGALVGEPELSTEDDEATFKFGAAVALLREDLALSDPEADQSILIPWDDLLSWEVRVLRPLRVKVPDPLGAREHLISVPAWADASSSTLFVVESEAAGWPDSGAHAIASLFAADERRVAHAWVVAWAKASAGLRADALVSAASQEAELKRRRQAAESALAELAARPKRRTARSRPDKGSVPQPVRETSASLVDLSELQVAESGSELLTRTDGTASSRSKKTSLREPDFAHPTIQDRAGTARLRNYTDEERESRGLELATWALGLDREDIADIRNQHGVGADAVDKLRNFYELKVHGGPIPDTVRLEHSQIERAKSTDAFFLVIVGNVEAGRGNPEVVVVADPLNELVLQSATSVTLAGVHSAAALRIPFVVTTGNTPE